MRSFLLFTFVTFSSLAQVQSINFPWESVQLTESDTRNFHAISFGDTRSFDPSISTPQCKAYPGSPDWPLDHEWTQLNASLGGALLKPDPPAIVCYPGPLYDSGKCSYLLTNATTNRFYINDPLTVLTEWTEGDTCHATKTPGNSTCTQGGYPVYVVNATTVKDIQIAVNFARNKNIRLVIKYVFACNT